jgi:serine/threonine-protein kinase
MSPERLMGQTHDGRADVYGVGVLLYELISGRVPVGSHSANLLTLMQLHLTTAPIALRNVAPEVPEEIEGAVMWALTQDPERRPNIVQFAARLREALEANADVVLPTRSYAESRCHSDEAPTVNQLRSEAPTVSGESHPTASGEAPVARNTGRLSGSLREGDDDERATVTEQVKG